MNTPLVSILIRTKNRAELLTDAVESVICQTYRPLEVVIVNDGGEEVNSDLLTRIQQNAIGLHYHTLIPAQGRSAAANKAMELSKGKWLLFLDDDDFISNEHIDRLIAAVQENKAAIGAYSNVKCGKIDENGVMQTEYIFDSEYDSLTLASENFLPIHSVLFHRRAIEAGCQFHETLHLYEDWHFWLQVTRLGDLVHVPFEGAYYRTGISGIGQPGKNIDYREELLKFLHAAKSVWSDEQLIHFVQCAKHLNKCQDLLTKKSIEYDQESCLTGRLEIALKTTQSETERLNQSVLETTHAYQQSQLALEKTTHAHGQSQLALEELKSLRLVQMAERIYKSKIWIKSRILLYRRRTDTLKRLLKKRDLSGIVSNLKRIYTAQTPTVLLGKTGAINVENTFVILATKHTLYVAYLVKDALIQLGFSDVTVISEEPKKYSDDIHVVICPQMFSRLPGRYIAFQMEQSVSSRWFNKKYFTTLENSMAIADYSLKNIRFLQENGLSYKQIFFVPISNVSHFSERFNLKSEEPEYDVVFYGDINNARRKAFLDVIGKKFKLLIVSEVFGEALYQQLKRAKVVINIHYYENALLETTRIFESLSLGLHVISEESSDMDEHIYLRDSVSFTELGNIDAMVAAIENFIQANTIQSSQVIEEDINHFTFNFARMLVALDLLSVDALLAIKTVSAQRLQHGISLSLPETYERYEHFKKTHPEIPIFNGLRHLEGWIGCAMSYQYLCKQALLHNLPYLEVCEDDALMSEDFPLLKTTIHNYLIKHIGLDSWDVFCGMIADVADDTKILDVTEYQGIKFVTIDRMTSMVYNIYNQRAMEAIANWDSQDRDVHKNTIDRYLQQRTKLNVVTTLPFCVGHRSELISTLWHFENSTYDDLIDSSEKKLSKKVTEFLAAQCT